MAGPQPRSFDYIGRPDGQVPTPLWYSQTRQAFYRQSLAKTGTPRETWGRKATGQASSMLASQPGCRGIGSFGIKTKGPILF